MVRKSFRQWDALATTVVAGAKTQPEAKLFADFEAAVTHCDQGAKNQRWLHVCPFSQMATTTATTTATVSPSAGTVAAEYPDRDQNRGTDQDDGIQAFLLIYVKRCHIRRLRLGKDDLPLTVDLIPIEHEGGPSRGFVIGSTVQRVHDAKAPPTNFAQRFTGGPDKCLFQLKLIHDIFLSAIE